MLPRRSPIGPPGPLCLSGHSRCTLPSPCCSRRTSQFHTHHPPAPCSLPDPTHTPPTAPCSELMAGSAIPSKAELIEYTEQHPVWASASEQRLQVRMGRCFGHALLWATCCACLVGGMWGSQKAGAERQPLVWAAGQLRASVQTVCVCVLLESSAGWLATHTQPCALPHKAWRRCWPLFLLRRRQRCRLYALVGTAHKPTVCCPL